MILEFSVKNFRSIRDLQTISFAATGLKSIDEEQDKNNIVEIDGQRILKTVGIYGANASGKSNVLRALEAFSRAIMAPSQPSSNLTLNNSPFYYQENPEYTQSFFQAVFLIEGKKYRYGFTVRKNIISDVVSEWLYGPANGNQTYYFIREGAKDKIKINPDFFVEGNSAPPLPYDHSLFLTHVASFENKIAKRIWDFFYNIQGNLLIGDDGLRYATMLWIENEGANKLILELLNFCGLKYSAITLSDKAANHILKGTKVDVFLAKINSIDSKIVQLNLDKDESSGTQKLFDIIGLVYQKFQVVSGLIILDELDRNFHPALVIKLIQLFNDPVINKANAQLLFTSHDTNLLDPKLMRRDQFYFTEKTEDDATRLYSLADLKGIRNDADFARQYLAGFYGALPKLEEFKAEAKDE
jgi:AAA15 family ATPase/GTPase